LILEQIRPHLRETDAPQAERRVRFRRQRQIVDFLVRADIERADDGRAALQRLDDGLIALTMLCPMRPC
jgi:hypothetical protein